MTILGMGCRYIEGVAFNIYGVFVIAYIVTALKMPRTTALLAVTAASVVMIFFIVFFHPLVVIVVVFFSLFMLVDELVGDGFWGS